MEHGIWGVADELTQADREALNIINENICSMSIPAIRVGAVTDGEFRVPKKGEWYLSGAIIEAYRAPNDLGQKFYIARLVVKDF